MYTLKFYQLFHGQIQTNLNRSTHPVVFLGKGVLKICSKFTGEQPCQNVITIKLLCNLIEIILQHGCSPVNLLYIFRITFCKNTSGGLLLTRNYNKCESTGETLQLFASVLINTVFNKTASIFQKIENTDVYRYKSDFIDVVEFFFFPNYFRKKAP